MSRDDELDNTVDDLIEQYVLFLRGLGPEPDLSVLPADHRATVMEQLKIVAALADRGPEPPSIEDDPVAMRLGLVRSARTHQTKANRPPAPDEGGGSNDDPVMISVHDLEFRFNQQVAVDFAPTWASLTPAGMRPVAQCTALGEAVAVFVADAEEWSHEPEPLAKFFREHPDISAVGLVSEDAELAVVVTAADAQYSVDPVRGWLAPHSPTSPEPLAIALGRHFERCLPEWERVADLDELLGLGDLNMAAVKVSAEQVAVALRAKPRLAHKKESLRALSTLDSSAIAAIVVDVQSGRLAGDELVDRVARLAEAAAP